MYASLVEEAERWLGQPHSKTDHPSLPGARCMWVGTTPPLDETPWKALERLEVWFGQYLEPTLAPFVSALGRVYPFVSVVRLLYQDLVLVRRDRDLSVWEAAVVLLALYWHPVLQLFLFTGLDHLQRQWRDLENEERDSLDQRCRYWLLSLLFALPPPEEFGDPPVD